MKPLAKLAVLIIALIHAGILVLEMFYWNHPIGWKTFGMTPQVAEDSAVLAANQGLYNGFLAAGLFWAIVKEKRDFAVFFLLCVIIAGLFGAATAKLSILYMQALPAALALGAVLWTAKDD